METENDGYRQNARNFGTDITNQAEYFMVTFL